ncbi:MAG: peptidoglycan DD-metalloendopeptidase family protein [Clostridia bacterium]|nr:peptidoglycan DD-metalloendopeptidase family protein [Clostridia bacterium]
MKYQKIICILLVTILLLGSTIPSFATNEKQIENTQEKNITINTNTNDLTELNNQKAELQEELKKANQQLEYVQGEISDTLIQIQELDDKIKKYENENQQLEEKLNGLQDSIETTSQKLAVVTEDYNQKEELLKQRMVALYKAGEISYLDVLLSANSLSDFLTIYYAIRRIAEYDNALIEKVDEERKTIDTEKRKLENESAQARILKAKAEKNAIIVSNTKTLQEGYIEQLSEQEKSINEKMMQYRADVTRVETKIQSVSTEIGNIQIQYTGGTMIWPVAKTGTAISSYYGTREHPIQGVIKFHQGIDIANTGYGAPAVAALDGVVTYAGWLGSYGNCVMIYHGNGLTTLYGHGQLVLTEYGAEVKQGDVIMQTGSTGNSTGPHLHFEVRVNGSTANPLQFVNQP